MPFPATVGQSIQGRTISPYSAHSVLSDIGLVGAPVSTVWPGATGGVAMYVPFRIAQAVRAAGFWWMNGATVNGNTDCGIYDSAGTKIVSVGATAQAGTNAIQQVALGTAIILPGGRVYYLALFSTSATATYFTTPTAAGSPTAEELRHLGVTDQTGIGSALGATLTHSTPGTGNLPVFGFYSGQSL